MSIDVTAVVPVLDEEGSLHELHERLGRALGHSSYEIIFIDDGSRDGTAGILDALAASDPRVGVLHFRRNFGKAAALDAGFRRARGNVVVTLDGDLQDLPEELPKLLAKLDEGYDVVSGWKEKRHDPLNKTLPSKIFNIAVARLSGLRLHDFNSGIKAYRREALLGLHLYGEMHRYVPVLLFWRGFRVAEVSVEHAPRRHGHSKYGVERLAKGLFDLLTVLMNTRYRTRPLHLFGLGGLALGAAGSAVLTYLTVLWLMGERPIGHRPLLTLGMLLVIFGMQLVSTGLLGEVINRQQHGTEEPFRVRDYKAPRS